MQAIHAVVLIPLEEHENGYWDTYSGLRGISLLRRIIQLNKPRYKKIMECESSFGMRMFMRLPHVPRNFEKIVVPFTDGEEYREVLLVTTNVEWPQKDLFHRFFVVRTVFDAGYSLEEMRQSSIIDPTGKVIPDKKWLQKHAEQFHLHWDAARVGNIAHVDTWQKEKLKFIPMYRETT